ncbi:hypothetical protein C7B80_16810 [Cyanosarcina cf. burmensis CCALA 770]|nr:hypothetical protein C7B80_16810 [Cyanosarcina cf. burmensis CCALA 770]
MSSPDFFVMTEQELRAYVLSHRQDKAAFEAYLDKVHERPPIAVIEPKEWSEERMQQILDEIKRKQK